MSNRRLETDMFGRHVQFEYSETWVGYALFGLRVIMGWSFLYSGATKAWDPNWSVRGFLLYGIPEGNPFVDIWTVMATEWAWLLTPLNSLGLTLVGLALIFGAFVRFAAFWGAVMMLFYWLAAFPLPNSILINYHVMYALLLFVLGAFGAGRILGLDAWIESQSIVENNPQLKLFLG
jgi:thiosulfate dehydrogenase [quinone] large subunit